jgi:hypothetical protein
MQGGQDQRFGTLMAEWNIPSFISPHLRLCQAGESFGALPGHVVFDVYSAKSSSPDSIDRTLRIAISCGVGVGSIHFPFNVLPRREDEDVGLHKPAKGRGGQQAH